MLQSAGAEIPLGAYMLLVSLTKASAGCLVPDVRSCLVPDLACPDVWRASEALSYQTGIACAVAAGIPDNCIPYT